MTHTLSPRARHLRRIRRGAFGLIALGVIALAAAVGGLAVALPWLTSHPEEVRTFLSDKLGRPVRFTKVAAHWRASGPVFTLDGLELEPPAPAQGEAFKIGRAELALDFYYWARRYGSFVELGLSGMHLEAHRAQDGSWALAQLGGGGGDSSTLGDLGAVSVHDASLVLSDPANAVKLRFPRADFRLVNGLDGRHFGGRLWSALDPVPLRFACRTRGGLRSGHCYVGGSGLGLGSWLSELPPQSSLAAVSGTVDLGVWFDWNRGLQSVQVEAKGHDWVLRGVEPVPIGGGEVIEPRSHFESPTIALDWKRQGTGWRVDGATWRDEAREAPRIAFAFAADGEGDDRRYALAAPRISLEDWLPYLSLAKALPDGARGWLFTADPHGELRRVTGRWSAGQSDVRAELVGLSFAATRYAPGLERINATLMGDADALILVADPNQRFRLDFAHVFRRPLDLDLHSLTLALLNGEDGARFEATDLALSGNGFSTAGRAVWQTSADGGAPFLDVSLKLGKGALTAGRQFWPVNVMPKQAVAWLDRALTSGTIDGGSVVFRGPASRFPFPEHDGRFEARVHISDADIDYHPDWPRAKLQSAEVVFADAGMDIAIRSGTVLGVAAIDSTARIQNLSKAVLELQAKGGGSGERLLDFVRQSPIRTRGGSFLEGMTVGGQGDLDLALTLPLGAMPGETVVAGKVELKGSDIHVPKLGLDFAGANGPLKYTGHGFGTDGMALKYGGEDAVLALGVGDFVHDPKHQVEAKLSGRFTPVELFQKAPAAKPLVERMAGRSQWDIAMSVDAEGQPRAGATSLALRSDLVGTVLDFPAPLGKPAEAALPTEINAEWPMEGAPLKVRFGELARIDALLAAPGREFAGVIQFGRGDPPARPARGLALGGELGKLDLDGWGALGGSGESSIAGAELKVGQLVALGHDFGATNLRLTATKDANVYSFAGANLSGSVEWPRADVARRGITARFERLLVPAPPEGKGEAKGDAKGDPKGDAKGEPAKNAEPAALAKQDVADPAHLPPLHVWCKSLKLGGVDFGDTRLETYPKDGRLHVEKFDSRSGTMTVSAQGDWYLDASGETSQFGITLSAEDLGQMLDAFGFSGMIAGGTTGVDFKGRWQGSPGAFSLARAEGKLEGKVGQGRILEVNPGAGRFFGLLSLSAIPRRLALDFSDFFKSGFSFDSIEGTFELHAGNAVTTDTVVRAPAAQINIKGRTGLARRDYDQEMEVLPKVGGVLPVVGVLALGPAGAAAGALLQGVMSKPLKSAASARYHVTGPWEKPEVTLIERGEARAEVPLGDHERQKPSETASRKGS